MCMEYKYMYMCIYEFMYTVHMYISCCIGSFIIPFNIALTSVRIQLHGEGAVLSYKTPESTHAE